MVQRSLGDELLVLRETVRQIRALVSRFFYGPAHMNSVACLRRVSEVLSAYEDCPVSRHGAPLRFKGGEALLLDEYLLLRKSVKEMRETVQFFGPYFSYSTAFVALKALMAILANEEIAAAGCFGYIEDEIAARRKSF